MDTSYPLRSRIHRMREENFFVKREDELGFGVSGSKLRKYVSILPVLKERKKKVAVVGSFYSNHVLSFVQILKQEKIPYQLFLEKPREQEKKGNAFFLSLLVQENEIIWIEKVPESLDKTFTKPFEDLLKEELFWIPMGACMDEALMGSLTLSLDIIQNEKEEGTLFSHIFVDAGTGMSAIGLILGMSYLQKEVKIYVTLIAGKKEEFDLKLKLYHEKLEIFLGESFDLVSYECLYPSTAKSFGSHNSSIFEFIKKTAENEGIFLDPLYTAKSLLKAKEVIKQENLKGDILWVHSGGLLSLSGFQSYFSL